MDAARGVRSGLAGAGGGAEGAEGRRARHILFAELLCVGGGGNFDLIDLVDLIDNFGLDVWFLAKSVVVWAGGGKLAATTGDCRQTAPKRGENEGKRGGICVKMSKNGRFWVFLSVAGRGVAALARIGRAGAQRSRDFSR